MGWLLLVASGAVAMVAGVVLPHRDRLGPAPGFPWFWVVFPSTCIAIAAAVSVFAWPQAVTGWGSYWWDPPSLSSPTLQFLSNEQYRHLVTLRRLQGALPVVSLVGIGLCVWAWRRRRI